MKRKLFRPWRHHPSVDRDGIDNWLLFYHHNPPTYTARIERKSPKWDWLRSLLRRSNYEYSAWGPKVKNLTGYARTLEEAQDAVLRHLKGKIVDERLGNLV